MIIMLVTKGGWTKPELNNLTHEKKNNEDCYLYN